MLILKRMKWSNCFSYGDNNEITFDAHPLTQLVGANGAGKTSISLMLQEIMYGKNNKNIKKQDITNNKSGKKGYSICLFFEKDGIDYSVHLTRNTNLKFKLYRGEEDISSHTSLNTYKTLANIIGIDDFKVFCQLIYQHSTDSLDFLTATDTNRKKFLISLLQLERYTELHEHFKDKARVLTNDISELTGGINTIESWIENHKDMDFMKRSLVEVPEVDPTLEIEINKLKQQVNDINSINKKIVSNNEYKKALSEIDSKYYMESPPAKPEISSNELKNKVSVAEHDAHSIKAKILKLQKAKGSCPQCLQEINEDIRLKMIDEEDRKLSALLIKLEKLRTEQYKALEIEIEIKEHEKTNAEFIRLNQLVDNTLSSKTLDKNELMAKINDLNIKRAEVEFDRSAAEQENREITAHNSKVDVVKEQLDNMKRRLHNENVKLVEKENLSYILELLKKTFSTNGLVSYKIESSVKELEKRINTYLADLTHFQIYFKLAGEKLNIEVLDDIGNVTSISNLSSGERARVNLATLLGIRSILSSLTNTKINLLFLDEITGSLDAEGKEKFTEILLNENLNTFFVSHEWTHPLVPQIHIIKEHHISRIENG